jgi:hypothetical protein
VRRARIDARATPCELRPSFTQVVVAVVHRDTNRLSDENWDERCTKVQVGCVTVQSMKITFGPSDVTVRPVELRRHRFRELR